MKILFISSQNVINKSNGSARATNRNYLAFYEIFKDNNVDVLNLDEASKRSLSVRIKMRLNNFIGLHRGLTSAIVKDIVRISAGYKYIFLETSSYGLIAYHLKRQGYQGKILTFFLYHFDS